MERFKKERSKKEPFNLYDHKTAKYFVCGRPSKIMKKELFTATVVTARYFTYGQLNKKAITLKVKTSHNFHHY